MALAIVGYVIAALLAFLVLALIYNAATGRVSRAYEVAREDTTFVVAGSELGVEELADKYRPVILQDANVPTPPLLALKYEVVEQKDRLTINYFQVWEDEIHPNPVVHRLYWIYRAARYGYPVRDIEYIQIDVSKTTGAVEKVRFETSPEDDFYVANSVHLVDEYVRNADGSYDRLVSELDGTEIAAEEGASLLFAGTSVKLSIATWNHLSRAATSSDVKVNGSGQAPLLYLDDEEYKEGKYARKSQGDFRTEEPYIASVIGSITTAGYIVLSGMGLIVFVVSRTRSKRSP